jgi:uncharacterized membrane protein
MDALIDKMETHQEKVLKKVALYSTAIFFIAAGARHFIMPEFFMLMMPSYLPVPLTLIYISGLFQIIGGIGLMIPSVRSFSAWGLMVLLLAVLPANVYLWTHHVHLPEHYDPSWYLMLRIPLQFLLIAWMYMFAKNPQNY